MKDHRRAVDHVATVVPTDIIEMHCLECGQRYTRSGNGLRLSKGEYLPCVGMPKGLASLMEREKCGKIHYKVYRQMNVLAMPTSRNGRSAVNLSSRIDWG